MSAFFTETVLVATVASGIALAVPLLFASLGEMYGQRSGVLNLGVDGVMLLGAFGAYYTVLQTDNVWFGLLVGIAIGIVFGLITAVMSVTLKAEQGISGIGVFLFGLGMSDLLFQKWVGAPRFIKPFPEIRIPGLADIPIVGEMLFDHSAMVYIAFAAIPISMFVLNHTNFGMKVRAVGENPEAADSLGVSVARIRYATLIIGGMLAGVGGAALAFEVKIFQQNLTDAAGFIAIALVYFGAWRPLGVMSGALLYGFVRSIVVQLKSLEIIPQDWSNFAAMAPAIVTILALVIVAQRFKPPTALTKPFERGR